MRAMLLACALSVAYAPAGAQPQDFPGDPVAGRAIAEEVCAECHGVSETYPVGPNPAAPDFAEIAGKPGMTGMALVAWLTGLSHPTMPMLILPPEETRNVIAYILSLEERGT